MKSPRIVQEGFHESTILGLVATGLGVAWVLETAGWRRPEGVVITPVIDLNVQVPLVTVSVSLLDGHEMTAYSTTTVADSLVSSNGASAEAPAAIPAA